MPVGVPSQDSIMEDYSTLEPDAPRPRLCHLRKRPDFVGYGFNLHAEKGKNGHFIGKIDEGSPADYAGLKEGDRIVEVNGTNIGMENHQQVVERIKAVPDETKFLVVDPEADDYYRDHKIVVSSDMPNVDRVMQLEPTPHVETPLEHYDDTATVQSINGRLCKLRTWPDYPGYGFNLHAEKGKMGQFIGKVDDGSPADVAGLREGDRIVAVNGTDVAGKTHAEAVKLIKAEVGHVDLLVIDVETNAQMQQSDTTPTTSDIDAIITIECPVNNPRTANGTADPPAAAAAAAAAAAVEVVADADDHQAKVDEAVIPPASGEHYARLCYVKKWPNGEGFGFRMLAEKGKSGHFIGTIDSGSPADLAGLRFGDRIVEVNGSNVEEDVHKQVVEKIRQHQDEVRLLVVDTDADEYFTANRVRIYSLMDSIKHFENPSSNPNQPEAAAEEEKIHEQSTEEQALASDYEQVTNEIAELANSHSYDYTYKADLSTTHSPPTPPSSRSYYDTSDYSTTTKEPINVTSSSTVMTSPIVDVPTPLSSTYSSVVTPSFSAYSAAASPAVVSSPAAAAVTKVTPPKGPVVINGVEFAASVEEARRRVGKKRDMKKVSPMSIKDKYALFQKL